MLAIQTSKQVPQLSWRPRVLNEAPARNKDRTPNVPTSDLSQVYPEAVMASSLDLGWQHVRVLRMSHTESEITIPPLENHCIIMQLEPTRQMGARIDASFFNQPVQPGDLTIIPAGTGATLRWGAGKVNETLHLYLSPTFVSAVAVECDLDPCQLSIEACFGVQDEQLNHIAMLLRHELNEANVMGRQYANSLAHTLALQLVRRSSCLSAARINKGGLPPHKLRKALAAINEQLERGQELGLSAVAEALGMSYFHFSRAFKQSMGINPINYLIEQRVERAKKLLAETVLPIAEISLRIGFSSQSHFTTTFRKHARVTPKAYRALL